MNIKEANHQVLLFQALNLLSREFNMQKTLQEIAEDLLKTSQEVKSIIALGKESEYYSR